MNKTYHKRRYNPIKITWGTLGLDLIEDPEFPETVEAFEEIGFFRGHRGWGGSLF